MTEQAIDFREESEALYQLLKAVDDNGFQRKTQFKGWTINNILGHLHMWNWAADLTLRDSAAFEKFLGELMTALGAGSPLPEFEEQWRKGLSGRELLSAWYEMSLQMAEHYEAADPKKRVKWFGPDMGVRSKVTARLMETWAHGQELFDLLGVVRKDEDRIKNIAQLGISTFGWTFINRKMDVPESKPYVRLTAPSGVVWEWNDPVEDNKVEGSATEFCQVVTQTRHIDDTSLTVVGEVAKLWMSIAQCFAGPPNDPPAPGTRFTAETVK